MPSFTKSHALGWFWDRKNSSWRVRKWALPLWLWPLQTVKTHWAAHEPSSPLHLISGGLFLLRSSSGKHWSQEVITRATNHCIMQIFPSLLSPTMHFFIPSLTSSSCTIHLGNSVFLCWPWSCCDPWSGRRDGAFSPLSGLWGDAPNRFCFQSVCRRARF